MSRHEEFHNAVAKHGGVEQALDALVPNSSTIVPFPAARELKSDRQEPKLGIKREAVRAVLRQPTVLEEIDTNTLRGTQPRIIRGALAHYLRAEPGATGDLYADAEKPGNRHPTVYRRKDRDEHDILYGHHRALAAHMRGVPLRARVVREE